MPFSIKSSDLANLSPAERQRVASQLAPEVREKEEESPALNARIRRYEIQYEISSDEMRRKIAAGEMKETADVARWLFLLDMKGRQTGVHG